MILNALQLKCFLNYIENGLAYGLRKIFPFTKFFKNTGKKKFIPWSNVLIIHFGTVFSLRN